jgi:hypothetical protein
MNESLPEENSSTVRGGNRRDDMLSDQESLDQLLARSKLLTSVLIALCFPVFPVAIAVPYVLLEGGHLWEAALLFETAIFVGLFILSYFVLSVTQLLSRRGPPYQTGWRVQP